MSRMFGGILAAALALAVAPELRAGAPPTGELTGVRIAAATGRTDFVVSLRGDVQLKDFALAGPDRLVLDLVGATILNGRVLGYDGVARGGITNVRVAQFRPDVVRIVLDLEGPAAYDVIHTPGEVRVTFSGKLASSDWPSSVRAQTVALVADDDDEPLVAPVRAASTPALRAVSAARPAFSDVGVPLDRSNTAINAAQEPRITVTWDRASIADVVAGFAAFSGRTIILGKGITGEVTAEIKNQPWPNAFQAILATQGLTALEMPGGIIRVDNPTVLAQLDSLEPLETGVVRINYAQASSLSKTVESVLTKGRGRVIADTTTNALIITDTKSRIAQITEFARGLDIRTPTISISAKLVFVSRSDIEQLGVKYDLGDNGTFFNKVVQRTDPSTGEPFEPTDQVVTFGGTSVAAIANADANIASSALDLIFNTTIGGFSLTAFLQALERTELSDIQAEPVISTLDNREADILVGEETPLRVVDVSSATGAGAPPRATVQFRETGIRLTVTPHVTANRQILMTLKTERSAIQPLAAADLGFIFQKQTAKNQLLVNDGETAVIGGLTVTEVTRTRSGIPLLGALPLIGKLFSYSDDRETRRDLIILVTPRIVDDGAALTN